MEIKSSVLNCDDFACDLLILDVFSHYDKNSQALGKVDEKLDNYINEKILTSPDFKNEFGNFYLFPTLGKLDAKYILLNSLGKLEELSLGKISQNSSKMILQCLNVKSVKTIKHIVPSALFEKFSQKDVAMAISEGVKIGDYKFDKYKKKENEIEKIELLVENLQNEFEHGVFQGNIIGDATNFARDLINESASVMTPSKLANIASEIEEVESRIYDREQIEQMNMNAYLAVARGSEQQPKLIHLHYRPDCCCKKSIALVGKGITFDSGGLDLKPASSMLNMKDDMSGAACVLAVIKALAKLKAPVEVHAIVAACENMIGANAYKPGDVLTAKNGKTIEIDNTDAEGRLTLADALCFADELKVDEIIDIATLTGACVVALGSCVSALMGNQEIVERIKKASEISGEKVWQLPLFDEYEESLKSDIAEMKNTGSRFAGAQTAGCFLKKFVKNSNWLHIDIAGPAFVEKANSFGIKFATGAMVRTILHDLILD